MLNNLEVWAQYATIASFIVAVLTFFAMILIEVLRNPKPDPDGIPISPRQRQILSTIRIGVLITFFAGLFFFLGAYVATRGHKQPCEDTTWTYQQGVGAAARENYDEAIKWYKETLRCKYEPKSEIHYRLGNIYYYGKKQLELALDEYTKAISGEYQEQDAAYLQRGRVYSDKWVHYGQNPDDYERAMEDFKKAIKLGGSPGELYLSMGSLQVNAHKYQEAITSITQAIVQNHELTQSNTWLGRAYTGLGKTTDAANAFAAAIQQAVAGVSPEGSTCSSNVFLDEAYEEFKDLANNYGLEPRLISSLKKALQSPDASCRTWAEQKLKEQAKATPVPKVQP